MEQIDLVVYTQIQQNSDMIFIVLNPCKQILRSNKSSSSSPKNPISRDIERSGTRHQEGTETLEDELWTIGIGLLFLSEGCKRG